jgi:hypothetical protein
VAHVSEAAVAIALVVTGASLAGLAIGWRATTVALALQYLGVVVLLLVASDVVAGLATAIIALGVFALFRLGLRPSSDLDTSAIPRARQARDADELLASFPGRLALRRPRRGAAPVGGLRIRVFDLTVVALAVVGAVELAITHPLFGDVATDVMVDVLLLVGLLSCLLGRTVRVTSGLLLLGSAGNLALGAAESGREPGEIVALAAAQLALAVALVYLRDNAPTPAEPSWPLDGGATAAGDARLVLRRRASPPHPDPADESAP